MINLITELSSIQFVSPALGPTRVQLVVLCLYKGASNQISFSNSVPGRREYTKTDTKEFQQYVQAWGIRKKNPKRRTSGHKNRCIASTQPPGLAQSKSDITQHAYISVGNKPYCRLILHHPRQVSVHNGGASEVGNTVWGARGTAHIEFEIAAHEGSHNLSSHRL